MDFPGSLYFAIVLQTALQNKLVDALKLETLNITGICPLVYQCLVPCLFHCTELKELILVPTTTHYLADVDEFVQALDGLELL